MIVKIGNDITRAPGYWRMGVGEDCTGLRFSEVVFTGEDIYRMCQGNQQNIEANKDWFYAHLMSALLPDAEVYYKSSIHSKYRFKLKFN